MKKTLVCTLVLALLMTTTGGLVAALAQEDIPTLTAVIVLPSVGIDMAERPFVQEICERAGVNVEWVRPDSGFVHSRKA